MSILPSGKRKAQVAQGWSRSASIFESDMFAGLADKLAQGKLDMTAKEEQKPADPKDLKMDELQQSMNESNTLPGKKPEPQMMNEPQPEMPATPDEGGGAGNAFIDISKQISAKVIAALGLDRQPNESWQGKTEIANDGDEVTGITIKLTRAMPKDMMMQQRVVPPGKGEPYGSPEKPGQSGQPGMPQGQITNSV